jgi:hypothetical protein
MKASCNAAKQRRRSQAQHGATSRSEREPMSLDVSLCMQGVALAGQALKFMIDTVQRRRDHVWWHSAGGCVQADASPCPGPGHPLPRPWSAWSCGRASARRPQSGACPPGDPRRADGPCRGDADPPPASGDAPRPVAQPAPTPGAQARRARRAEARWDCRGRTRRHPHGRHRRCLACPPPPARPASRLLSVPAARRPTRARP